MNRTRTDRSRRLATRTTSLLLVTALVACSTGTKDAADSAAPANQPATGASIGADTTPPAAAAGDSAAAAAGAAGTTGAPAGGTGAAAASGALLDPNSATREQLTAVPGMTAAGADALIAGRPYQTMVAVDQALAKQIGATERKTVYARLWKPIDLNKAAAAEILLIPGVGPRMQHEFEEYRPYKSIEQFRREIGKYVDKNEVARLEQYVAIK